MLIKRTHETLFTLDLQIFEVFVRLFARLVQYISDYEVDFKQYNTRSLIVN